MTAVLTVSVAGEEFYLLSGKNAYLQVCICKFLIVER